MAQPTISLLNLIKLTFLILKLYYVFSNFIFVLSKSTSARIFVP